MGNSFRRLLPILFLVLTAVQGAAQDANILQPVDTIEARLEEGLFQVVDERGSRFDGDRTSRVALAFPDGEMMVVKWARAPRGGEEFNNAPRYELAAYEIQKLFLDEPEYVVPPTVLRAFPRQWYRTLEPDVPATLSQTDAVVVALQYWLFSVTDEDFWDPKRFGADTAYARNFANFNLLTYLIRHNDANVGNFLVSTIPANPRVFSVDNGLAFASRVSDRGARWRDLRVERVPDRTVERLRALTREQLTRHMETLAQFRVREDAQLVRTEITENVEPRRGVRVRGDIVQFGLTEQEIDSVWRRVERLLSDVDRGRLEVF